MLEKQYQQGGDSMEELLLQLIDYVADDYTEEQENFLKSLLANALKEVTRKRYRGYTFKSAEERKNAENSVLINYDEIVLNVAKFHYDKQGKEGVMSYSESGQSVSYESSGTPSSFLEDVIPITRVVRGR